VIFEKYSEDRKDILLDGTVHKKESPPGFIEMRDGDTFYMFLSIEEALCFDGLPKDVSLHQVRAKFCELAHGEWTAVVGFNWRRVEPEVPAPTEEGTENSSTERFHYREKASWFRYCSCCVQRLAYNLLEFTHVQSAK
jgi:hypothetical protein